MRHPSGEQLVLERGDLRAVVTEVGATLRQLSAGSQQLVWGFGPDEMCSRGRGQLLAPWPNRLDEGRYRFGDHDAQAALDEPDRNCAIHGLTRWLSWRVEERTPERAVLALTLHPSPGYPFALRLEVAYELGGEPDGLRVHVVAANDGDEPLPFGLGFHPYLEPGPAGVDAASLAVPAGLRIPCDSRGIPCGPPAPVTPSDAVAAVVAAAPGARAAEPSVRGPIGAAVLDECVTGLRCGPDGCWRAVLTPGAGGERAPGMPDASAPVEVWAEECFGYCEVFTADSLPGAQHRRAVALEPMTCPPNAFRSGAGLLVLAPGERFAGSFGIRQLR